MIITFKTFLKEATIKQEMPKNPNQIDPALLTFEEYYKIANEHNKWHDSDSYDWSLEYFRHLQETSYLRNYKKRYPIIINTFSIKGKFFELRAHLINRHTDEKYIKYNDETDEIIRDEKGLATYMTPEELVAKGVPLYGYGFVIVDKDINTVVGTSQDEWGAILIVVAREYRGYGLGKILTKITRQYLPGKGSGGFTDAGRNTFEKVYREYVKKYLISGKYSKLLKDGRITLSRVNEILKSAKLRIDR